MSHSSPMYETETDIQREAEILDFCCTKWQCRWEKTPAKYPFDAAFIRKGKEVAAFAEVKARSCESTAYQSAIISLEKWRSLMDFHKSTALPTCLIIGYTDGIIRFYWLDSGYIPKVVMGGRTDRGNPNDYAPQVELPNDIFSTFNTVKKGITND